MNYWNKEKEDGRYWKEYWKKRREAEAKAERMKGEIAARKEGISYNEYQNRISRAMGYGCGSYCGD